MGGRPLLRKREALHMGCTTSRQPKPSRLRTTLGLQCVHCPSSTSNVVLSSLLPTLSADTVSKDRPNQLPPNNRHNQAHDWWWWWWCRSSSPVKDKHHCLTLGQTGNSGPHLAVSTRAMKSALRAYNRPDLSHRSAVVICVTGAVTWATWGGFRGHEWVLSRNRSLAAAERKIIF